MLTKARQLFSVTMETGTEESGSILLQGMRLEKDAGEREIDEDVNEEQQVSEGREDGKEIMITTTTTTMRRRKN